MTGGKDRQKNRAKTFPGVAKAMAEQWGDVRLLRARELLPEQLSLGGMKS